MDPIKQAEKHLGLVEQQWRDAIAARAGKMEDAGLREAVATLSDDVKDAKGQLYQSIKIEQRKLSEHAQAREVEQRAREAATLDMARQALPEALADLKVVVSAVLDLERVLGGASSLESIIRSCRHYKPGRLMTWNCYGSNP